MFGRKKKPAIKVIPAIPRKIGLRNRIAELAQEFDDDHAGNIRICSDLIAMRNEIDMLKAKMLKDAMDQADKMDFFSKTLNNMIDVLQSETPQEPLHVLSNGGLVEEQIEAKPMQTIGFLSNHQSATKGVSQ